MWLLPVIPVLFIFYQDIRYRAISWWTLPFLFGTLLLVELLDNDVKLLLENGKINLVVFIVELVLIFIYFSIKNNQITNIFKSYLGLGDVLFFVVITPFFHPIDFLFFQIISLLIILIFSLGYGLKKKYWTFKIPLAGILSVLFYISFVFNHFFPNQLCLRY
ncbi:MAG: hypothetical protein JXQ69_00950 [Paludibacteraceae bacterium]|nr:hypothetical protein [Paludibacteraceae bacterium]